MTSDKENRVNDQLAQALDQLPRELEPPAGLEDRIVQTLNDRGLMAKTGKGRRLLLQILPLAATLVLGFFLGRVEPAAPDITTPAAEQGRKFILILRESSDFREQLQAPEEQMVGEYGAWAGQMAEGQLLGAEKLKDMGTRFSSQNSQILSSGLAFASEEYSIAGFFLVQAGTMEEALAIAKTCPHLSYGGVVEVREIDPV